jgi:hypothetical protein
VDRRSDPGRLAIVLRQEDGTLIGVIDTAADYDDARPLAIDAAFSQRARIALYDPDALIRASWDPSTLPLAPLDRQATVTLGQVSIRVTRGADMTNWVALLGETRLVEGSVAGHEALSETVCRAASTAQHSPLLRSHPRAVAQLRALSAWSLG